MARAFGGILRLEVVLPEPKYRFSQEGTQGGKGVAVGHFGTPAPFVLNPITDNMKNIR
jgi:hypothetical protein